MKFSHPKKCKWKKSQIRSTWEGGGGVCIPLALAPHPWALVRQVSEYFYPLQIASLQYIHLWQKYFKMYLVSSQNCVQCSLKKVQIEILATNSYISGFQTNPQLVEVEKIRKSSSSATAYSTFSRRKPQRVHFNLYKQQIQYSLEICAKVWY